MKYTIAKSIAASSLIAPLANATISIVVPNETITSTESLFVDFSTGTTSSVSGEPNDILFDFAGNPEKPAISRYGEYTIATTGNYVARYDAADALNFTNTTTSARFESDSPNGPWAGGATGYAAVQNLVTSKEIWLHIDYDDANNTLTLLSFAYTDASDNMTAGQIPEPAQTAALMAVIAGSAAAFRRRRRLIDFKN